MNKIVLKNGYIVKIVESGGGYRAQLIPPGGSGAIMEPHGSDRIKAVTTLMRDLMMGLSTGDVAMGEEIQDHIQDTLDQQEDVDVYLYFPSDVITAAQKRSFEKDFRQWARTARQYPNSDIVQMADHISSNFGDTMRLVLHPISIKNEIVKKLRGASFVRFNVRSPKGKKIWIKA